MQLEDFRGPWPFPRFPLLQSPHKEFTPNHAKFTLAFSGKESAFFEADMAGKVPQDIAAGTVGTEMLLCPVPPQSLTVLST